MSTQQTRQVVENYFSDLANGDLPAAMALLDDNIVFELPMDRYNEVIPYLGRHVGVEAVERAFGIRAETTEVLDYAIRDLRADGDVAVATIYTRARHTRTLQQFEIEDTHKLTVGENGKIVAWKAYFDPNGEIAAFNADREERLIAAVSSSDHDLVSELIRFGGNVNHRDQASGLTPLLIAAGRADAEMVQLLLDAGADVYAVDSKAGATALHKACQGGSVAVVQLLLDAGAFVDAVAATTGHTPLFDALWFKQPEITKLLLDRGAGLNLSTHYGFSLQEHFQYELNVNTTGKDLLLQADQYLKERRAADERAIASQQLMKAVTDDDTDKVRQLIASGAAIDERYPFVNGFNDHHTPLLVAARDGHTEITRLLLDAGADVNAVEPIFGAVPLHKAVYNGRAEITRMIANAPGVNLNFQGATNGYAPLHDALWHGYAECAQIVLDAGAATALVGHDGKTPLDLATEVFGAEHPLTQQLASLRG